MQRIAKYSGMSIAGLSSFFLWAIVRAWMRHRQIPYNFPARDNQIPKTTHTIGPRFLHFVRKHRQRLNAAFGPAIRSLSNHPCLMFPVRRRMMPSGNWRTACRLPVLYQRGRSSGRDRPFRPAGPPSEAIVPYGSQLGNCTARPVREASDS